MLLFSYGCLHAQYLRNRQYTETAAFPMSHTNTRTGMRELQCIGYDEVRLDVPWYGSLTLARRTLDPRSSIVTPAAPEEHRGHKTNARSSYRPQANILLFHRKNLAKGKEGKRTARGWIYASEGFIPYRQALLVANSRAGQRRQCDLVGIPRRTNQTADE